MGRVFPALKWPLRNWQILWKSQQQQQQQQQQQHHHHHHHHQQQQQEQELHMQPTNETSSFPFLWWDLARHLCLKVEFAAFLESKRWGQTATMLIFNSPRIRCPPKSINRNVLKRFWGPRWPWRFLGLQSLREAKLICRRSESFGREGFYNGTVGKQRNGITIYVVLHLTFHCSFVKFHVIGSFMSFARSFHLFVHWSDSRQPSHSNIEDQMPERDHWAKKHVLLDNCG